jgi:hypothetical protein
MLHLPRPDQITVEGDDELLSYAVNKAAGEPDNLLTIELPRSISVADRADLPGAQLPDITGDRDSLSEVIRAPEVKRSSEERRAAEEYRREEYRRVRDAAQQRRTVLIAAAAVA